MLENSLTTSIDSIEFRVPNTQDNAHKLIHFANNGL